MSVHIPPLRQRPADLQPLIEHFLKKYRALGPSEDLTVDPQFVAALAQVELPGNARQLENLVRCALVNKETDVPLNLSDLPPEIWRELSEKGKNSPGEKEQEGTKDEVKRLSVISQLDLHSYILNVLDLNGWNLSQSLEHCEKLLVESALQHTHGNQSQTAKLLGITPRSVYNKVRKHHLH